MVKSMTGYGQGQAVTETHHFTVEVRSVNHRFADINLRLPREFTAWEGPIRQLVAQYVNRGRIDLVLKVEPLEAAYTLQVNYERALAYHAALVELAHRTGSSSQIPVSALAQLPDVFHLAPAQWSLPDLWPAARGAVVEAMEGLRQMRRQEGQALATECGQRLKTLSVLTAEVEAEAPLVADAYRQRLQERLAQWQPGKEIDEDRLAAEIVYLAERSNITEEVTRLHSHLDQLTQALQSSGAVGRRMEFLLQEAHRETQTIGAKAQSATISKAIVAMKSELESLREQAQNIE